MCGIAGVLLPSNQAVTEQQLAMFGEALSHRGPDNCGTLLLGNCGFAHTRLSIIDLSDAGNQPITNGRYTLVYNGEIYNYLALRKELLNIDVQFKSTSDTEVLFYYLMHFGIEKTLNSVQGMFAFSFYDASEQHLFLCRDRLGIKPLFWMHRENSLYWASEVKAIATATSVEPDPVKALYGVLSIGDHSNNYTVFKNIHHVPPGSYLAIRSGQQPTVHTYYSVVDNVEESYYKELDKLTVPEIQERFEMIFSASIKSMLMSDAPMGAFVSGGIDSSLLAVIARDHTQDLSLFTSDVIGRHSEVDDARLLARTLNQPLFESKFTPEMMLDYWVESTYHYEIPIVTHTNAIPFAQVAKLANRNKIKAVLTGEGSDELFLGYPKLLTRRFDKIAKIPVSVIKSFYKLIPALSHYLFPEESLSNVSFMELLVQDFERQRLRAKTFQAYHFLPPSTVQEHSLSIQMIREGLLALLVRNDRMGMLAGIEARFPFLDEDMIRFAVNLPLKHKIGRTKRFYNYKHPFLIDKLVVRRSASKYLPEALVYKRKNGFPMYGHKEIRVKPGYFTSGYVAEVAGLTSEAEKFMIETYPPYFVAKLVSVDVFGRLFGLRETQASVRERLNNYVTIQHN